MLRLTPLLPSLLLAATSLAGQTGPTDGGIVYGSGLGVAVKAPPGWIFDLSSGASQGLDAVMYPVASSWDSAKVVMYVRLAPLAAGQTLEQFIDDDLAAYRTESPDLAVTSAEPIAMRGGASAQVRRCSGDRWGNHEAVAYTARGSAAVIFVLASPDAGLFESSLPAFETMVAGSALMEMVHPN